MLTVDILEKKATSERYANLTATEKETPEQVGNRVLSEARNSVTAFCNQYGGEYDESNSIITDAVYSYAIGLLYNMQQLSQGNDEMQRAENQIKAVFAQSNKNTQNPNYGKGTVAAYRIDVEDE